MKFDKKTILFIILLLFISTVTVFGFSSNNDIITSDVYKVYLDGEVIGLIKSKEELENYIDNKQNDLKTKYKTDKVYPPNGLSIDKYISYNEKISTAEEIYNKIKDIKPFTINAYVLIIKGEEEKKVYVLNKDIINNSINKTVRTFVDEGTFNNFKNNTQPIIKDVGSIVDNISIKEELIIKEELVDSNNYIFTTEQELTKYLLFGTTEQLSSYMVQKGDTIQKIALDNKLNTKEFLIANPSFTSENNLLFGGQEVIVGLINPIFNTLSDVNVVSDKTKQYQTETRYDANLYAGQTKEIQAGEDGVERVSERVRYENGQLVDSTIVKKEEIRPAINRIIVKGSKVQPTVGDLFDWVWPTNSGYSITSPYGYRWGAFHDAIDIAGTGLNSPIYASNNGVVAEISYDGSRGKFIVLNHNNGYYTTYLHLNSTYVSVGDVVAAGQVIGGMGRTGYVVGASGIHLHFGVWKGYPYKGGATINPCSVLRGC